MSHRLLNLRGVPEDEAGDIRDLLDAHGIAFYETPPSGWGISAGAIWLKHDRQVSDALALLQTYQTERARTARDRYQRERREGIAESLWHRARREPFRFAVYLAVIALVLFLSTKPFLGLAG
jgi:hypothetical protein